MVALVKASQVEGFPAKIDLVISNKPDAPGLQKAKDLGVLSMAITSKTFPDRRKFEIALDAVLKEARIDFVCCAGVTRVLTP